MNKHVKVLISVLTVMLISSSFVGCQSASKTSSSAKVSKQITVWSHLTDPEIAAMKPIAAVWAKQTGNTVKIVSDKGTFQAYLQAANSSKGPDIMYGLSNDNLGTFQKANLLAEVPKGIIDTSKYMAVSVKAGSFGGKLYAVPISVETYGLFYNTDKVKTVPKSVADLIVQAQKVGFQYDINNFYYSYCFVAANGGYVFKDNGNGALDPTDVGLGNAGAIKGYQEIKDLVSKYKFMTPDVNGDKSSAAFKAGKAGFYISGPWDVAGFQKAGVKFAVAPLPGGMPSFVGVQTAFVNAKSKNQKEAWDLVKYLQANNSSVVKIGSRIPALNSDLAKPEYASDPIVSAFIAQVKIGQPMPNIAEMSAVWTPVANNLTLLTNGKITAAAAAKFIKNQVTQGIAAMK